MTDTFTPIGEAATSVLANLIPRPVYRYDPSISSAIVDKVMKQLEMDPIADDWKAARQFGAEVATVRRARERLTLFARVDADVRRIRRKPSFNKNYTDPSVPLPEKGALQRAYKLIQQFPERGNLSLSNEYLISEGTFVKMRRRLRREGKI